MRPMNDRRLERMRRQRRAQKRVENTVLGVGCLALLMYVFWVLLIFAGVTLAVIWLAQQVF